MSFRFKDIVPQEYGCGIVTEVQVCKFRVLMKDLDRIWFQKHACTNITVGGSVIWTCFRYLF